MRDPGSNHSPGFVALLGPSSFALQRRLLESPAVASSTELKADMDDSVLASYTVPTLVNICILHFDSLVQ